MSSRGILAIVLALAALGLVTEARASAFRFTDAEGVTHITNAPTDPRYRQMAGFSATAAGWLRVPEAARGRYAEAIREIAVRHGVSPGLVEAVIRVESAFNPWAVSPKGAQGLMQLMPRTAYQLGVRDSFHPQQNIEGGVRHLRYLLDRYAGNVTLALAAYNAGENAVDYYRGVPPYAETQQYVRKVLGPADPAASPSRRVIYRYQDADGAVIYSNLPPPSGVRLGR